MPEHLIVACHVQTQWLPVHIHVRTHVPGTMGCSIVSLTAVPSSLPKRAHRSWPRYPRDCDTLRSSCSLLGAGVRAKAHGWVQARVWGLGAVRTRTSEYQSPGRICRLVPLDTLYHISTGCGSVMVCCLNSLMPLSLEEWDVEVIPVELPAIESSSSYSWLQCLCVSVDIHIRMCR